MQFRGLELYIEIEGIIQDKSDLSRIFSFYSLNWHTFRHVSIAFWCPIAFRKHGKSPIKNWQHRHVLIVYVRSWRNNAGARELPENHLSWCITMHVHANSQPIVRCDACAVCQKKHYGGRRRSCREVSSANKKVWKIHMKRCYPLKIVSPIG